MDNERRKNLGAYFTPDGVAAALVRWVVRSSRDRLLDPSAGDGRFIALHRRSVGVETDALSAKQARRHAPWALVHEGDFFSWASSTKERFECAAGNPPFIRYQRFNGEVRARAQQLCSELGVDFSSLSSSWAPFLVAAASVLKPGGRMAFVVPAEIGHAPYAAPLIKFLLAKFGDVRILALRDKVFPDLSEDVWILYADAYGEQSTGVLFSTEERFKFKENPPNKGRSISIDELARWNFRLRPFLLSNAELNLYRRLSNGPSAARLGDLARVGIGYVTGANDFFHLRPSVANRLAIPEKLLRPSVRNGRALPDRAITPKHVAAWIERDEPCLLLSLGKADRPPAAVRRYLESREGSEASESYKCRTRDPWYSVPDVVTPSGFLAYMSGKQPALVANGARCVGTNSVHTVQLKTRLPFERIHAAWQKPLTALSCEIEGHPLGGGMLKVEPREAQRIAVMLDGGVGAPTTELLVQATQTLRRWRHYCG